jgi:hypothetical protein
MDSLRPFILQYPIKRTVRRLSGIDCRMPLGFFKLLKQRKDLRLVQAFAVPGARFKTRHKYPSSTEKYKSKIKPNA